MIVTLHHVQHVLRHVLVRRVPGVVFAGVVLVPLMPPIWKALALADGVDASAPCADRSPGRLQRADLARSGWQMAQQELAERLFADEADAGRILLACKTQARRLGHLAHVAFVEVA